MNNINTLTELLEEFYQEYKIFYEGSVINFILRKMKNISGKPNSRFITSYYFRHRNIGQTEHEVFSRIADAVSEDKLLDLIIHLEECKADER